MITTPRFWVRTELATRAGYWGMEGEVPWDLGVWVLDLEKCLSNA